MAYFLLKCFFGTLFCCFVLGAIALYATNYGNYETEQLVLHFLFLSSSILVGITMLSWCWKEVSATFIRGSLGLMKKVFRKISNY